MTLLHVVLHVYACSQENKIKKFVAGRRVNDICFSDFDLDQLTTSRISDYDITKLQVVFERTKRTHDKLIIK